MPHCSARGRNRAYDIDRLETLFFRRALGSLSGASKDVHFHFFSEDETQSLGPETPTTLVRSGGTLLRSLNRGGLPTAEQALREAAVDVLLTKLDAPSLRIAAPKVLFTLDLAFHNPGPKGPGKVEAPLPKQLKKTCAEAKVIVCPSVYVNKICASQLDIGLEKTVVARCGVSDVFGADYPSIIEGPYALFLLNRYTHPNLGAVVEAIRRNRSLFPPTLVVCGHIHPDEPADWGLPLIRVEQCPDRMLAAMMQHAQVVLYPAKGDGSGMHVLQAMRAGARIITSKSGAVFELAGTAPFYCEPDNPTSLLQVMRRMLDESDEEHDKRKQMGRSLVMDCTWERCGAKMVSALKRSLL